MTDIKYHLDVSLLSTNYLVRIVCENFKLLLCPNLRQLQTILVISPIRRKIIIFGIYGKLVMNLNFYLHKTDASPEWR